ncbi:hypothetical protein BaRGS_00010565, partial [Batillaria attramentaria]
TCRRPDGVERLDLCPWALPVFSSRFLAVVWCMSSLAGYRDEAGDLLRLDELINAPRPCVALSWSTNSFGHAPPDRQSSVSGYPIRRRRIQYGNVYGSDQGPEASGYRDLAYVFPTALAALVTTGLSVTKGRLIGAVTRALDAVSGYLWAAAYGQDTSRHGQISRPRINPPDVIWADKHASCNRRLRTEGDDLRWGCFHLSNPISR